MSRRANKRAMLYADLTHKLGEDAQEARVNGPVLEDGNMALEGCGQLSFARGRVELGTVAKGIGPVDADICVDHGLDEVAHLGEEGVARGWKGA